MAGVRSTAQANGKFQGWYKDAQGRRIFFTGTHDRKETLRIARKLEDDHRQVKLGYRDPTKSYQKSKSRLYSDVTAEYMEWGRAQGGIGGRAWSFHHARKREFYLKQWGDMLNLQTLADLDGILPAVEDALRHARSKKTKKDKDGAPLPGKPLTGKSQANYADGLKSFCEWLVERGQLAENPLKGLAAFDMTPRSKRRAMTAGEISRLFAAMDADPDARVHRRRLGYEVALASGLRKGELQALVVGDLDIERGGLLLHAEWTKNRQAGFQPLPRALVDRLALTARGKAASEPLLFVSCDASKSFARDLRRAGIPLALDGKLDFHAMRVAYVTFLLESGADVKTVQTLARHSNPSLTLNTYGRARADRLAAAAELIGNAVLPEKCATGVQLRVVGGEGEFINGGAGKGLAALRVIRPEGLEPPTSRFEASHSIQLS